MDWKAGRRSSNVQDRRGVRMKKGSIGIGGIVVILIGLFMGADLNTMLGLVSGGTQSASYQQSPSSQSQHNDEKSQFVSVILASNEDLWQSQLRHYNYKFRAPQMILFSDRTQSGCGLASAKTGPFYCPADEKIYIDLNFIQDMQRLGATRNQKVAGNFAMAYVIGHEFGHHISNLIGTLPKAHRAMKNAGNKTRANAISVALELQADCFAGVWAANLSNYNIKISRADIEAGLRAAAAVGDDHIMQSAGQSVNPENFTHGSAKQRSEWFTRGLQSGDMQSCNTFR